ncbi:TIGR03619 family F420-dependent LLM class oxidoreductase [Rhodococcus globerulus]|uniref:TIGR03619 family F420-dependent LLM class oxidoreductase n=1 Tax=Rhodococcus globerulus TaxID=33008 RepID=UPI001C563D2B|nr:TIGR03619 family F420-dependent LLM class oxidoreductase [Rhodococcus globerulus]QXW01332.1 TIGR03619 family F420-dependent LLM class oxidoreductase [Rhodococcus globerulus]
MMRYGAWVPTRGTESVDPGIQILAQNAENAGFDLMIIPDHIVMRTETNSWFPFAADGVPAWDPRAPWIDAIVSLALCAAVTNRIEFGTGVLVLPQREPVILAKQLATIDAACCGRLFVGVGAGWLAEEYEALNVPFEGRGQRMDEWIALLRNLWSGEPSAFNGEHYSLPDGVLTYPTPPGRLPILVGGMSPAAIRRAASADGWFALQHTDALDVDRIRSGVKSLRRVRHDTANRVVLRAVGDLDPLLPMIGEFQCAGVTDLVIDADLTDMNTAQDALERMRQAGNR